MGMNEFKLQFYFNLYKEKPFCSRDEFRLNFQKEHGKFVYLPELIRMIEDYQMKKYGETITNHFSLRTRKEARILNTRAKNRKNRRLNYERKN